MITRNLEYKKFLVVIFNGKKKESKPLIMYISRSCSMKLTIIVWSALKKLKGGDRYSVSLALKALKS